MSQESDLVTYLNATAGVTTLIGQRVYPTQIPQEVTLPAVGFFRVDTPAEYVHSQALAVVERPRFQFDCWASTYLSAIGVAAALKTALLGWRAAGGKTVRIRNQYDLPEPETERWRRAVDVEILDL